MTVPMPPRRRSNRRKKSRKRTKPMLNILDLAQTGIILNAASMAVGGLPIGAFLLEGWATKATGKGGPGLGKWGSAHPSRVSAAEMVQSLMGDKSHLGSAPGHANLMEAIKTNLSYTAPGGTLNNGTKMVITAIATPILFKAGKQLLGRPVINPINRGIKKLGLQRTVKV